VREVHKELRVHREHKVHKELAKVLKVRQDQQEIRALRV
jgi:hypothetical protein